MLPADMPQGVFRFFLDVWFGIRSSFAVIVELFTESIINIDGNETSLLSVLIGSGIFIYFSYIVGRIGVTLITKILDIIF